MRSFLLAAIVSLFLISAGSAQAAPAIDGLFDLPETPSLSPPALGPDGNVWVPLQSATTPIAKVAPDGTVTGYASVNIPNPIGIGAGPDGNMWVTGTNYVGKFSPADPTNATATPIASFTPNRIIAGRDGNMWTGSGADVYRIPTANPAGFTKFPTGIGGFTAKGITVGTDGRLWLADGGNGGVLPVGLDGTIGTEINLTGMVQQVVAGPNNQIAYTNPGATPERIGLINNDVAATPLLFTVPPDPFGITFGQDGAYWIAQFNSTALGRYTTDGQFTTLDGLPAGSGPRTILKGAGDTLWVTLETAKKIARVSGIEPPDSTPPAISKLKLTNSVFRVGPKKTALVAKKRKAKTGTTIKFTLSEAGTVTIAVEKAAAGRKSGKSCVKPTRKLKKAKKCTRYVPLRSALTRTGKLGANSVAFSGRLESTKLKPGKYRFALTAKDARGNVTPKPARIKFQIVPN